MGQAGDDRFLIVTETKELLKLPLNAFTPTQLTIPHDTERLSLNDSPFNFTSSSLWLTDNETSLLLMAQQDESFYQIDFEGKGSNYKAINRRGSFSPSESDKKYIFLTDHQGSSAHLLMMSDSPTFGKVTFSKNWLQFNQTNGQIDIRYFII